MYRQRLIAFGLSGALAGFAGGLYVHYLPINVDAVYLDLTFITLAMLVIGGMTSLWGAVVGALASRASTPCSRRPRTARPRTIDLPWGVGSSSSARSWRSC